jgi:hypothetical protein
MRWRQYNQVTNVLKCLFDTVSRGYTVTGMDINPKTGTLRVFVETFNTD